MQMTATVGDPEDGPRTQPVPCLGIRQVRRNRGRIPKNEHVVGGTINDQRDECRQEGTQTQIADQDAVYRAEQGSEP